MDAQIAWWLVDLLVYPGLLFMIVLIIITQWMYRKVTARIQYRRGPIHAGPFGILQPLADLIKLLSKEDVINEYGLDKGPILIISLAIGGLIAIVTVTPVAIHPITSPYDSIVIIYLLALIPFSLAFLTLSSPNPYTNIGIARYLALLISAEPPLVMSLLAPIVLASKYYNAGFSVYYTSIESWRLWFYNPVAMFLAAVAAFISMLGVMMVKPFDSPEAEAEIYWGLYTELGGPRLALGMFAKFAERIVYPLVYTLIFLGFSWPITTGGYITSTIVVFAKFLIVFLAITIIDASMPRFRPDQLVSFFVKYMYPISILSLVIAFIR
ncbi:complex I subunit 1 family protein [Thermogladius sp. 4427co]|uniref:complex I subunit 1 family protein n=1 Tax=Thermogladius sp. 4427co TaxID=3450718 RepID=UPI003F7B050E